MSGENVSWSDKVAAAGDEASRRALLAQIGAWRASRLSDVVAQRHAADACLAQRLALRRARLAPLSLDARCRVRGLEAGRADVIVAGLCILDRVLELAGVRSFAVSGRGVRFGVAYRLLDAAPSL